MLTLKNLGIVSHDDVVKNLHNIIEVYMMILDEFAEKHPEFIEQCTQEHFKHYVNVKDICLGDEKPYFYENKT